MSHRLERCPVCRAGLRGDEPVEEPCRRCRADLSSVRLAEREAERAQQAAQWALAGDEPCEALRHARCAVALADTPATRATLCAALAANGHLEEARALLAALAP